MLASERGEDVIATYHSHPRSEAYPSQTDINEVRNWDESLHLICSLEDPDAPVVRAFLIRGTDVEEARARPWLTPSRCRALAAPGASRSTSGSAPMTGCRSSTRGVTAPSR